MRVWRRRAFAGQEWANRDATLAGLFFVLVVLAGLHPFFVVLAIAIGAALVVRLVVLLVRRRRREREVDATSEFWVDRIDRA